MVPNINPKMDAWRARAPNMTSPSSTALDGTSVGSCEGSGEGGRVVGSRLGDDVGWSDGRSVGKKVVGGELGAAVGFGAGREVGSSDSS